MKRLIFLLLMAVVMVGILSACDIIANPLEANNLEAVLSSNSVSGCYTAILGSAPEKDENTYYFYLSPEFTALINGYDYNVVKANNNYEKATLNTGQETDYWLLL